MRNGTDSNLVISSPPDILCATVGLLIHARPAVAVIHYDYAMAERAKARTRGSSEPSAKNERSEYDTFQQALKKVLSVSHSELKIKIDSEKGRKPKRASGHAATESD
jgi:hypothetical protein